jgi:hypothetical protein
MVAAMDRHMWRVIVVESNNSQPKQDVFYFWTEEEAEYFSNKTNNEAFNEPDSYRYALKPVQIK